MKTYVYLYIFVIAYMYKPKAMGGGIKIVHSSSAELTYGAVVEVYKH